MALQVLRVGKDQHSDAKFNASQKGLTLQQYVEQLIDKDTRDQKRTPLSESKEISN